MSAIEIAEIVPIALGAFFYLVMDILIHWGVFRGLRHEIGARGWVLSWP